MKTLTPEQQKRKMALVRSAWTKIRYRNLRLAGRSASPEPAKGGFPYFGGKR